MKLKKIYSLMAGAAMMLAACSPDDYGLGGAQYSSEDLKCPEAYTVTIEGNYVTLESKLKGCTPLWVTPNGRSQEQKLTIGLPFAGDYEVALGAETRAGTVYGEPYKFNLPENDFAQLEAQIWEDLAGGVGKKKRWVPCNGNYGIGQCTGPVMYMSPDDVKNDGSASTDLMFGSANWAPNWDPGFQSWLIPADDPYMSSYMEFGLDAKNGCTATVFRNEAGGGTTMNGKFNLNVSDMTHPVISFSDCYSLHNVGFDEVCSNYTQDIKIIECTPYLLQIATMRTNSEGPWWIVWNFVSQEVIDTKGECIPKEDAGFIEKTEPQLSEIDDLLTKLFSVESNGVTYVGNQITYILNDEQAYDWLWWNGSPSVNAWESVTKGNYDAAWSPKWGDEIEDFELVIEKKVDPSTKAVSYIYTAGDAEGNLTIRNNKLIFDNEITILTASNDQRTVEVKGKEFQIMKLAGTEELVLGVPASKDENGNVNSYLVANLMPKAIGGGQTGPTVVDMNNDFSVCWDENNSIRVPLWSTWTSVGLFKDVTKVKLKKNQTIKVTLKVKPGVVTWDSTPKCALITNLIPNMADGSVSWEPGCYDGITATDLNINGETTLSLTNTTGSTVTFTDDCLMVSIQYATIGGTGDYKEMFESVTCVIE